MLPMDPPSFDSAIPPPELNPPVKEWSEEIPYSVPRRFGLGAMMVVTTAFAGLFALLRGLGMNVVAVMLATFYLLAVALAQMFYPKSPRAASVITGTALFPVCAIVVAIFEVGGLRLSPEWLAGVLTMTCFLGPICGYLAGALASGLFLMMDKIHPDNLARQIETPQTAEGATNPAVEVKDAPCS